MDLRNAARSIQKLRRRVDLERTDRERKVEGLGRVALVAQCVTRNDLRAFARAARKRRHLELYISTSPLDRGYRQVAVPQRLDRLHIRPRDQPAADAQERLDREAALAGLQRAIFRDQRRRRSAVDADDGP